MHSSSDLFSNKATVRALQISLGVPHDGDVGPITLRALNRRLGVGNTAEMQSETIFRLQENIGIHPPTGLIDQATIAAFNKHYDTTNPSPVASQPRGNLRAMASPAALAAGAAPAPKVSASAMQPSSASTNYAYSFSVGAAEVPYRYMATVSGNGEVSSHIQQLVNGRYIPGSIEPRQQLAMDRVLAKSYKLPVHLGHIVTPEQAANPIYHPAQMPQSMTLATSNSDARFFTDYNNATTPQQKEAFLRSHAPDIEHFVATNPQDFKYLYQTDRNTQLGVNAFVQNHPDTSLSQTIRTALNEGTKSGFQTARPITLASTPAR